MQKIPLLLFIVFGTFCIDKPCKGEESDEDSGEEFGNTPGAFPETFELVPIEANDLMQSVRYYHNSIAYFSP